MTLAKLVVCSCCALEQKHVADALEAIRAEHGDQVEISQQKCLDICAEFAAVALNGEVMVVSAEQAPVLVERVRAAVRG